MKVAREREIKLDADPGFVLPDLRGRPLRPRTFTSTYYDTPERRLLRSGITLRRRVENRIGVWQLKLPADDGRYELEERGGPSRPPPALAQLLVALVRGTELRPAAKLRTRREGVRVGGVEVTVDTVSAPGLAFVELEAEAVRGDGAELPAIGKALRRAGARKSTAQSKLARVLGGDEPPPTEPEDPLGRLRRLLLDQHEAMLRNDPGVRLGEDAEALHQLRVATRRARSLLRAASGLVAPEWAEPLRAELGWLGALLAPVRDLDVLLEHLGAEAETLDAGEARVVRRVRGRLAAERDQTHVDLLEAMGSDRYFRLLDALGTKAPAGERVPDLGEVADRAFARLRKRVKTLPARPSDGELHRVRIETKRARYAAELAGRDRVVSRAKEVQDMIGDHQDACVAQERLHALAPAGAGRLLERERRRKRAARRAFPRAWERLEKAGRGA